MVRVGTGASAKCGVFVAKRLSGPQAVVQSFYDWYFDESQSGDADKRPEIAKTFKTEPDYDVFTCGAQDSTLRRLQAGPANIAGLKATVVAALALFVDIDPTNVSDVTFSLALGPSGWQITAIDCEG